MCKSGQHDDAGFTLLEMLVTLAIMALLAGLAFPAVGLLAGARPADDGAARVREAMAQARSTSLRQDTPITVRYDPLGHRLVLDGGRDPLDLPRAAEFELPRRGLTFYPDGSATGGAVTVRAAAVTVTITVDPLTGRVSAPTRRNSAP